VYDQLAEHFGNEQVFMDGVQALQPNDIGSPRAGGFIGLVGSGSILVGGLVARAGVARPRFAGTVSAGRAS
jgi:hypothetical protein